MDCFTHPAVAAVGTCRNCSRGLCHACVVEVSGVLACRGRCEQGASGLASSARASGTWALLFPLVWLVAGGFLISAYHDLGSKVLGTLMIGASVWALYRTRKR